MSTTTTTPLPTVNQLAEKVRPFIEATKVKDCRIYKSDSLSPCVLVLLERTDRDSDRYAIATWMNDRFGDGVGPSPKDPRKLLGLELQLEQLRWSSLGDAGRALKDRARDTGLEPIDHESWMRTVFLSAYPTL